MVALSETPTCLCLLGFVTLCIVLLMQSISLGLIVSFLICVVLERHEKLNGLFIIIKRDLIGLLKFARINWELKGFGGLIRTNQTVPMIFQRTCNRHPDKVMLLNEERKWTFRQVDEFSNKIAMAFHKMGFRAGDNVALLMENRPEFVMVWLGLSKTGVATALINTNLKSVQLIHCINVVNVKAVIFTPKLAKNIIDVYSELKKSNETIQMFCYGEEGDFGSVPVQRLQPLIENAPNEPPSFRGDITDRLLYMYTSGTTGLPKAAIIKHVRYISFVAGAKYGLSMYSDDTIYICHRLFHAGSGMVGAGQALLNGATCAIATEFSAPTFWEDCAKFNCTVAMYIGASPRYLLAQPRRQSDRGHNVRMMYGNTLLPQIWEEFQDRFGIRELRESYGSTEGNSGLINMDNTVGALGFFPFYLRLFPRIAALFYPIQLIRVDENEGLPLRDRHGLCILAGPGEVGELIMLIRESSIDTFDGYTDKEATSQKLCHNVFRKGDVAFASGDLLIQDELGYLYFKDRRGDTFRWKGENVSTTEIEGILTRQVGLSDVIVYGVPVPGCGGKAGMAAILDPERKVNLETMFQNLSGILAPYAIPVFVRLLSKVDVTETYKLKKNNLIIEAFDITQFSDPVYFLDLSQRKYIPFTDELYSKIKKKQIQVEIM